MVQPGKLAKLTPVRSIFSQMCQEVCKLKSNQKSKFLSPASIQRSWTSVGAPRAVSDGGSDRDPPAAAQEQRPTAVKASTWLKLGMERYQN